MHSNRSTSVATNHVGKAVFEVGDAKKAVTVEFDTLTELLEQEDELTWKHWPHELRLMSVDYRPMVEEAAA
jgi:hypothetical protein